jgi:hypothetical protein
MFCGFKNPFVIGSVKDFDSKRKGGSERMRRWARILSLTLVLAWAFALAQTQSQQSERDVIAEIDAALEDYWKKQQVTPAPPASDSEFLRRIYLDLVGNLPPEEMTRKFLSDNSPDKKRKLVEELLSSKDYANWWATLWRIWLIGRDNRRLGAIGNQAMEGWLREKFAQNVPYNRWVYELLTATGRSDENGAVIFFVKYDARPEELAGAISRIFLGTNIQCAQCHDAFNDPRWKQNDFWSTAAYFARTRFRPVREKNKIVAFEVWDAPRGEAVMEKGGQKQIVAPKFVFASFNILEAPANRREAFATYMTSPQNRLFAQALVNRYWAYFFGQGLVHPIDDFRPENPPAVPEVLEKLTDDFIQNGYDLKRLIRIIVGTRAYQLSCRSDKDEPNHPSTFAQAQLRPLMPEQLVNAILRATGIEEILKERASNLLVQIQRFMVSRFVFVFETDGEPDVTRFEQTIQQALMLMNNEQIQRAVRLAGGLPLMRKLDDAQSDKERLDILFLRFYCRYPTPEERRVMLEHIGKELANIGSSSVGQKGRAFFASVVGGSPSPLASAFEDIAWALLNSGEFLFNH